MSQKIMLPMGASDGRDYAVTWTEQLALAGKYGMTIESVRASLVNLSGLMATGVIQPRKTATKTKALIASYIESSNAAERQGA